MKTKFHQLTFCLTAGINLQANKAAKYILETKPECFTGEDLERLVASVKTILQNPLGDIINRLLSSDTLGGYFNIMDIGKASGIPEVLVTPSISIDLKHDENLKVINTLPLYKDKVLINGVSFLKHDRAYGTTTIGAMDIYQAQLVRGFLVGSYHDLDGWLDPYSSEYIIRTYSTILSSLLARYYSLSDYTDIQKLNILFSLFYAQRMSKDSDNLAAPPILNRCNHLGTRSDVASFLEVIKPISQKGLTVNTLCELIKEHSPDRMRNFTANDLYTICGNLGPDNITSKIALEYPPYWVFMILASLSGNKLPIIFQMNQHRLSQEGKTKFLHQLMTSDLFERARR